MRVHGRYMTARHGQQPAADHEAAGRPVPVHHALELPARHGHPQDRPGDRGRLHDGGQAGPADAAVDARARRGCSTEAGLPTACSTSSPTTTPSDGQRADHRPTRGCASVSFTGSTEVGRKLVEQAADQCCSVSMELGGNAPFLVFDDADLDAAVDGAMLAKMRNMGEACTAANRFLVHDSRRRGVRRRLAERMGALTVGRGNDDGVDVGPLIDEKPARQGRRAGRGRRRHGAPTCWPAGRRPDGPGYFYAPTVLTDVAAGRRVLSEEIFGPVAPITTFDDRGRGHRARPTTPSTAWSSYVYTRDLKRALRVSEALEFGMVGLNTGLVSNAAAPFGGVKAVGLRSRGRLRGHRGVPRDHVRGSEPLTGMPQDEQVALVDEHGTVVGSAARQARVIIDGTGPARTAGHRGRSWSRDPAGADRPDQRTDAKDWAARPPGRGRGRRRSGLAREEPDCLGATRTARPRSSAYGAGTHRVREHAPLRGRHPCAASGARLRGGLEGPIAAPARLEVAEGLMVTPDQLETDLADPATAPSSRTRSSHRS